MKSPWIAGKPGAALEAALLILVAVELAGCGRADQLPTAQVRGTVTLDGKPLTQGMVSFTPERGRAASGQIGSDGSFVLSTYGRGDGAILGHNRVAVVAIDRKVPPTKGMSVEDTQVSWLIPAHYGNPNTSGLSFDVQAGTLNTAELQLTTHRGD